MAIPALPRLRPGQMPTAGDWNALCELVEALQMPTGSGYTEIIPSVLGPSLRNLTPREFWARITDDRDGNFYGFQEVAVIEDGTTQDQEAENYGVVGDSELLPAVEVNGNEDVAADTIVKLTPSPFGAFFTFDAAVTSGELVRWVMPTASEPNDVGNWPGVLLVKQSPDVYISGDEIRLTFGDIPTTSTLDRLFVSGNAELGTRHGTVSEDDDPRIVTDGVTTSLSTTVTSATAAFTSADVGAAISGSGIPTGATIISVESSTSVTISVPATLTASGVSLTITSVLTYPLYHARAHQQDTITVCIDGVNTDQCWQIPGWIINTGSCTVVVAGLNFSRTANSQYMIAPTPMRI